jgi:hypothetical protein
MKSLAEMKCATRSAVRDWAAFMTGGAGLAETAIAPFTAKVRAVAFEATDTYLEAYAVPAARPGGGAEWCLPAHAEYRDAMGEALSAAIGALNQLLLRGEMLGVLSSLVHTDLAGKACVKSGPLYAAYADLVWRILIVEHKSACERTAAARRDLAGVMSVDASSVDEGRNWHSAPAPDAYRELDIAYLHAVETERLLEHCASSVVTHLLQWHQLERDYLPLMAIEAMVLGRQARQHAEVD